MPFEPRLAKRVRAQRPPPLGHVTSAHRRADERSCAPAAMLPRTTPPRDPLQRDSAEEGRTTRAHRAPRRFRDDSDESVSPSRGASDSPQSTRRNVRPRAGAAAPLRERPVSPPPLGARVRVHWPAEHQWFEGVVQRINVQDGRSIFNVAYDDGDDQWHAASQEWSLVIPAVPAARAVRHDEHGRPILRGHPPPRQRELMLQWLHANGHLRAPEWDGDPTAIPRPLKNLWERTSAAR